MESNDAEVAVENLEENEFSGESSEVIPVEDSDSSLEEITNLKTGNQSTLKQLKAKNSFLVPQSRKRKIVTHDNNISAISAAIDKLDKVTAHSCKHADEDEFDIFARFVAVQLRQMPLYNALLCQEHIQTVIRQQRLQLLSDQSIYQASPSSTLSNDNEIENFPSPKSSQFVQEEMQTQSQKTPQMTTSDIIAQAHINI